MSEETEIEFEAEMAREEIADVLETFASNLRESGSLEIELDDRMVTIDPPERVEFEVELEDEPDEDGVERSIEFELEWMRGENEDPLPEPEAIEE